MLPRFMEYPDSSLSSLQSSMTSMSLNIEAGDLLVPRWALRGGVRRLLSE